MSRLVSIYVLSNPVNFEPFYVGQSVEVKVRNGSHRASADNLRRGRIIRRIKAVGLLVQMTIIDRVRSEEADSCERGWIAQFKSRGFLLLNRDFTEDDRERAYNLQMRAIDVYAGVAYATSEERSKLLSGIRVSRLSASEAGKPWSPELSAEACEALLSGRDIAEIAASMKRSTRGVMKRLRWVARSDARVAVELRRRGERL